LRLEEGELRARKGWVGGVGRLTWMCLCGDALEPPPLHPLHQQATRRPPFSPTRTHSPTHPRVRMRPPTLSPSNTESSSGDEASPTKVCITRPAPRDLGLVTGASRVCGDTGTDESALGGAGGEVGLQMHGYGWSASKLPRVAHPPPPPKKTKTPAHTCHPTCRCWEAKGGILVGQPHCRLLLEHIERGVAAALLGPCAGGSRCPAPGQQAVDFLQQSRECFC
jgi:hypothetical protein